MACSRNNSGDSSDFSDCEEEEYDICAGGQCSRGGRSDAGGNTDHGNCSGNSCSRGRGAGGSCSGGGCGAGSCSCRTMLPFDPSSIENILLMIFDKFDFRLLMEERTRSAMLVTAGFAIAGGLLGKHVGGKVGAAVGGAVGGACGITVVAISMKEAWNDIKYQLSELTELVYDYIAGLDVKDYQTAANLLMSNGSVGSQLATLLISQASSSLGKNIISSITNN